MGLSKLQLGFVATGCLILGGLLFLGRTKPTIKKGEEVGSESKIVLTIDAVLTEARTKLDSAQIAWLTDLDQRKAQAVSLEDEARILKLISRTWNEYEYFLAGGYYAVQVAKLEDDASAWAVAGTTFGIAYNKEQDNAKKKLAAQEAIKAFQQAVKLEPDTVRHWINEAVMFIDLSTVDASTMPMKGVLKLRDLDQKFPNNIAVNMTLGRLSATRTKDLAKAKPRFEKVISIAQSKSVEAKILMEAHYFLIECYQTEKAHEKVIKHYDACITLSDEGSVIRQKLEDAKQQYIKTNSLN